MMQLNKEETAQIENFIQKAAPYFDLLPGVVLVHNIADGSVAYISKLGEKKLEISQEELKQLSAQDYYSRFFNQEEANEYVPQILGLLQRNNSDEIISFFQQVRVNRSSDWKLYSTTTKIFYRDDEGKPLLLITFSMPLNPEHHLTAKVERLIAENNFLRKNKEAFASLTKREQEVLQLMAVGQTPEQVASKLFISEETAKTHRKHIKAKLGAQNNYDFTRFAQAFDLI